MSCLHPSSPIRHLYLFGHRSEGQTCRCGHPWAQGPLLHGLLHPQHGPLPTLEMRTPKPARWAALPAEHSSSGMLRSKGRRFPAAGFACRYSITALAPAAGAQRGTASEGDVVLSCKSTSFRVFWFLLLKTVSVYVHYIVADKVLV